MRSYLLLVLGFCWQTLAIISSSSFDPSTPLRSVAYFTSWSTYTRQYFPSNLPAEHLTHVNYAYASVAESGTVSLSDPFADVEKRYAHDSQIFTTSNKDNVYGCIKQLQLLKKGNPKLKVLLSVGGPTASANFTKAASSSQGIAAFANSSVQLLQDLGLDGLDVVWQYPEVDSQASNYVTLLNATRMAFKDYSDQYSPNQPLLLTVAAPANPQNYNILHIPDMVKLVDFWNLIGYDYYGNESKGTTTFQSNIFKSTKPASATPLCLDDSIQHYLNIPGFNSSNLNLGMPLNLRRFTSSLGIGLPCDEEKIGGMWDPGYWDYGAFSGTEDPETIAWYSHNDDLKLTFVMDTLDTLKAKTGYIIQKKLGGAMWWESSGDREGLKIKKFSTLLGGPQSPKLDQTPGIKTFPNTKYPNLKMGFPVED